MLIKLKNNFLRNKNFTFLHKKLSKFFILVFRFKQQTLEQKIMSIPTKNCKTFQADLNFYNSTFYVFRLGAINDPQENKRFS